MQIRKTATEILREMLDRIPDGYDKGTGGLFYDNLAPVSIQMEGLFGKLLYIFQNSFAETAVGIFLDYIVEEIGLERRQASKAKGTVTLKGNPGTVAKIGLQVSSESFVFETTEEATLSTDGVAEVPVVALEPGKAYNLPAGAIDSFPVTVPGLQEVTNGEGMNDGYDAETDEELRARYFFKVRNPVTSGNVYHYQQWCLEVEGVGGVKVYPLWAGNGTVKCVITDSRIEEAPEELVKRVAEHLEQVRPIGATVTVESAAGKKIAIAAAVILADNVSLEVVDEAFQVEADKYLKEVGFVQNYVSYARLGKILLSVPGVLDYEALQLNGAAGNIPIDDAEVPVLGIVTLSESEAML